jgi:hypothetical protein
MASTHCTACGRTLRDTTSVRIGLGPVCRQRAGISDPDLLIDTQPVLNRAPVLRTGGLIARRLDNGRLATNVPHAVVWHSPDGFECGYSGSGPAELALNILHLLIPPKNDDTDAVIGGVRVSREAVILHQDFKRDFLSCMNPNGGYLDISTILNWIDAHTKEKS